ncbi:hypothetical protein Tco_0493552 [Tanacetum coccineum]
MLGKDDKPLNAYKHVQFEEPTIIPDDAPTGEAFNSPKDCVDNVHESAGNGGMKLTYFASMFKDNTSKKTVYLSELRNNECVSGADLSTPLTSVDEDDMFETDKSAWQKSNNIESTVNDSNCEEVKNVFVKDNGKSMDDLVDDARKKMEAPPTKTLKKTGIWSGKKADSPKRNIIFSPETKVHYFDREDIEEVEHENAYNKKS